MILIYCLLTLVLKTLVEKNDAKRINRNAVVSYSFYFYFFFFSYDKEKMYAISFTSYYILKEIIGCLILYYSQENNNSLIKKKNHYRIPTNYESDDYFLLDVTPIRN